MLSPTFLEFCEPSDLNGVASVVVTPAVLSPGVSAISRTCHPVASSSSLVALSSSSGESAKSSPKALRHKKAPAELVQLSLFVPSSGSLL